MSEAGSVPSQFVNQPLPMKPDELPFSVRVARGLVSGQVEVVMRGRSLAPVVLAPDWSDVTSLPVEFPPAATFMEVSSTSNDDAFGNGVNPAGPGCRSVTIWGLPAGKGETPTSTNAPWQAEMIPLDGTTWIPSTLQYLTGDAVEGLQKGADETNMGDITMRTVTGAIPQIFTEAGALASRSSHVSIPAGWEGRVTSIQVFWTGINSAVWELRARRPGESSRQAYDGEIVASNSGHTIPLSGGIRIAGEETCWFRAQRTGGSPGETIRVNAICTLNRI